MLHFFLRNIGTGEISLHEGELPLDIDVSAGDYELYLGSAPEALTVTEDMAPVNTGLPLISGNAEIGQILNVSNGVWDASPTPGFTYQWLRNSTPVSGANGSSYTPVAADDGADIVAQVTATNTAGAAMAASAPVSVTYAAPNAALALPDVQLALNTGIETIDPTGDFSVPADPAFDSVNWSLLPLIAGISINAATGAIGIDTATTGALAGETLTVTATNSGGAVQSAFQLTVESASGVQDQAASFGALSPGGTGGFRPVDGDGNEVDLISVTDQAGTVRNWSISDGRLVADGTPDADDGRVITVSHAEGSVALTVTAIPDAYSVADDADLAAVMALSDAALAGRRIYGRAGDFDWVNGDWSGRAPASVLTVASHDDEARMRFAPDGAREMASSSNITFDGVDFKFAPRNNFGQFAGPALSLRNTIRDVVFRNCDADGSYSEAIAAFGAPPTGDRYSYRGFLGGDGGSNWDGVEVRDCDIHNIYRGLQIYPDDAATNPVIIEGNRFSECSVDCLIIAAGSNGPGPVAIRWNRFSDPVTVVPPSYAVSAVDLANNRMTIPTEDLALAGATVTMNIAPETVTPPGGTNFAGIGGSNDYQCTILSVGGGETVIQFPVDLTDTGDTVFIRAEPEHADFVQGIPGQANAAQDWEFLGNVILGSPGADGGWPQGIFTEDIAGPSVQNYYESLISVGNLVYTGVVHGLSHYAVQGGLIADNTAVGPDSVATTSLPAIRSLAHFASIGRETVFFGNAAQKVSSDGIGDILPANHEILPADYAASGLFLGSAAAPASIDELIANFARADLDGTIDYENRIADLPSYNAATLSGSFDDVTGADPETVIEFGPVQVTAIARSDGAAAAHGVLVATEANAELRITSDAGGAAVVTDWTSAPAIAETGQHVWLRMTSAAGGLTETTAFIRIGRSFFARPGVTTMPNMAAPVLSAATDAQAGTISGLGSVSTDDGSGTLYWVLTDSPVTPTPAEILAGQDHMASPAPKSGSQAVSTSGAQPEIAVSGLVAGNTYHFHFAQENSSGSLSAALSSDGFTTATPVFLDSFTSDTSGNYQTNAAAGIAYDAANEGLLLSDANGAFPAAYLNIAGLVAIEGATLYRLQVAFEWVSGTLTADHAAGSAPESNLYVGSAATRQNFDAGGATFDHELTTNGNGDLYLTLKMRGGGDGTNTIRITEIRVFAS